jgi:hypothetical protein
VEVKHHFRRTPAGSSQLIDLYWAAHPEGRTVCRHHSHQCENLTSVFVYNSSHYSHISLHLVMHQYHLTIPMALNYIINSSGIISTAFNFLVYEESCLLHLTYKSSELFSRQHRLYIFSIYQPSVRENNRSLGLLMFYHLYCLWRKQDKYISLPCYTVITTLFHTCRSCPTLIYI